MAAADAGADSKTPPVGIGWGRDKFAPAPAADGIGCGRLATGAPDGMPSGMGLCSKSRNDMTALGEENEDCGETPSEKMQRKSSVNQPPITA